MSTLKEEFLIKQRMDELKPLIEIKYMLDEYCILLEDIDQAKLNQMADAIVKLRGVVAGLPLPILQAAIDQAAKEMHDFVTNKDIVGNIMAYLTKNKMGNPMTKGLALFTGLDKFFKQNLPQILKSFQPDAEQGEQQLDEANNDPNAKISTLFKPETLKRLETMFIKGLQTGGFLGFFFQKGLPYLNDLTKVAEELTNLTLGQINSLATKTASIQLPISPADQQELMGKTPVQQQPTNTASDQVQANFDLLKGMDDKTMTNIVRSSANMKDLFTKISQTQQQANTTAKTNGKVNVVGTQE